MAHYGVMICFIPYAQPLIVHDIGLFIDMRKALSRDVEKKSMIPLKRPVTPDELEYD